VKILNLGKAGLVGLLLALVLSRASAQQQMKDMVFHDSLGAVIDTQENSRYNIFGDIPGFTAARLVKETASRAEIFIMRNFNDRAQILALVLPATSFAQIKVVLANRIAGGPEVKFEFPVLPIEENQWQERSTNKTMVLRDGSKLMGVFVRAHGDTIVCKTNSGLEISVPSGIIAGIRSVGGEAVSGQFYRNDPNTSRLFFAPTGRRLKAGCGYFADYWIFFPTAAFGITDYFSFAGGMSLIPGAESQLFYLMPKLTFEVSPNAGIGAGLMHVRLPEESEGFTLGYGVATFGKPTGGVTVGAGAPLGKNAGEMFILLIGGETQVSNNVKLISENWFFLDSNESVSLFSGGVRFFGDKLAVDLALFTATEAWSEGGFPFFPWVDFSVFWGK